jgi:hypothetical protein
MATSKSASPYPGKASVVDAVAGDIRRARERHRAQAISLDTGFLDRDRFRRDLEFTDRKTEASG